MRLLGILAALAAGVLACESDPCSESNCFVLSNSCQSRLATEPEYDRCREATGVNARFDNGKWCVAACQAWSAEAVMECAVREQSACLAPEQGTTPREVIVERCSNVLPRWETSCWETCEAERDICEDACPVDDFFACVDCSGQCGTAFGRCLRGCPKL